MIQAPRRHGADLARVVALAPFQRRAWAELAFFGATSAVTLALAATLAFAGATALLLTVVGVGVPLLAGCLRAARGTAGWLRGLAQFMVGETIDPPEPFAPRPGMFGWLRAALGDPAAWRAVLYLVAKVPLTLFGAWFALSLWAQALILVSSPLTGGGNPGRFGLLSRPLNPLFNGSGPGHLTWFLTGVLLLFVAPWPMRVVVDVDLRMMRLLLGPSAASSRVQRLEESRDRTVEAATETLRRIERNLHDGTQAQLIALAMRLGQAKEKLDGLPENGSDMDAVRRLVDEAHRGAKEAITDLRDLARGIHPPALDTGLPHALATLAARCPVPTEVTVTVPTRPSPAVEAITYFCAAELLANVAQHSRATRASLTCAQHGPWLRVVVRDNGGGGALIGPIGSASSGLAGLADRISTVDGHLGIASPVGGPTSVIVDLPCRT